MNQEHLNPFFTTYEYIPFDKITEADYEPAMMKGIEEEDLEIDRIVNQSDAPTFENTIVALSKSGETLEKVTNVFYNLLSAETTDFLDELAQKMSPIMSEHTKNITLNTSLFERVKVVYEDHKTDHFVRLNEEEKMLLTDCYDGFIHSGANLPDDKKQELRKLSAELGIASLQFSQNKLKDTNDFLLHLTKEEDLEGLPESAIDQARQAAKEKDMEGYVITLQAPSFSPFITYSAKRDLREKIYMAYNTLCTHDNDNNNVAIVEKIVNLHRQIAQLKGYKNYADYVFVRRMAEKTENVYQLFDQLIDTYMPTAQEETKEVENLYYSTNHIDPSTLTEDDPRRFRAWDFAFYANKLKESKFNINSEMLRPYFELGNVKKGVFGLATKLYGITFKKREDIPTYHPDVETYDVIDKDGSHLALLYCDFHPRATKKSGAWMTSFREQERTEDGKNIRPQVSIVMNLSKPTDSKPALLTLGEVETFLHEFGHALHGIFANTTYSGLSGTNVYWDFVELPSQFMENYSIEPEFLNTFATHYETSEIIPKELIDRITQSRNFNCGCACMRQVSFGLLDMAFYTMEKEYKGNKEELINFERQAWSRARVRPDEENVCMTTQFSHIMAGGYSAGYYSYKWAEVLDADAFSLFQERGIFDPTTAQSFRDNVLSKGGTEHPMTLYKRFRGGEPTINALLKRNGITPVAKASSTM